MTKIRNSGQVEAVGEAAHAEEGDGLEKALSTGWVRALSGFPQ